ncbi:MULTISPECIES: type II toxin-antitoxin system RelB/DinJ family antitoxin [unclassified Sinorhizobium]|uniref:type II toxin-antitoxin system RelB/DinJ family antitoxin n=1 Tax=unclassified Sinorhizobium TaxID=2613772 RepID=UPI003526176D
MTSKALVHTHIDAAIKDRAAAVLEGMGLTVSDAVRILLTRTANEGALPLELFSSSDVHDPWLRAKVTEALHDTRADIEDADLDAGCEQQRAAAFRNDKASER